jgi:AraC-like DNA-binding protein
MHLPLFQSLLEIMIDGGIILGLFVILLLNSRGVRKSRANIFLSILLGSLTFSTFHVQYAGNVLSHFSVSAYSIGDPTFLLIAPLLWFYIIELTGGRVTSRPATFLHFIPFLLIILSSISFSSLLRDSAVVAFFNRNPRLPFMFFWITVVIQFSVYQYFVRIEWQKYQMVVRQELSNTENVSLSWVRFFMTVFLTVNLFFLFGLFAAIHLRPESWIWTSVGVILSMSIFAIGYKGILQKDIFDSAAIASDRGHVLPKVQEDKVDPGQVEKLVKFMTDGKPFLDSELSLSTLSKAIGVNRNQLSQLINNGVGENFYDFVNRYRVEEVKRLMSDPQKQNYNLLGIALEAGFKSKSTFNLIFKRFTGLTPTEYKKNMI